VGPAHVLSPSHLSHGHAEEQQQRGPRMQQQQWVADGCYCIENSGRTVLADGIEYPATSDFYAIRVYRMGQSIPVQTVSHAQTHRDRWESRL
jgi:hypothetical protein